MLTWCESRYRGTIFGQTNMCFDQCRSRHIESEGSAHRNQCHPSYTFHWDFASGIQLKIRISTNIARNKSSQQNHWNDTAENVKEIVDRNMQCREGHGICISHEQKADGNVNGEIITRIEGKGEGKQMQCIKADMHLSGQWIAVTPTHLVSSSLRGVFVELHCLDPT